MDEKKLPRITVEAEGCTMPQKLFIQAVIMPEIAAMFDNYANVLAELDTEREVTA